MFASIWGLITALPTLLSVIKSLFGIADDIKKALQTDPVKQQQDANAAQTQAQQQAGSTDDTSGVFGGK